MRQIGTLPNAAAAQQFAAYLVTQKIGVNPEQDGDQWTIWIKNEDQVPAAKEALEHFRQSPGDARYQGVIAKAKQLVVEEKQQRAASKPNVVEMRGQWQSPMGRSAFKRTPLTMVLIGLSIAVTLMTNFGKDEKLAPLFYMASPIVMSNQPSARPETLPEIRSGQVWRLLTPIFIHLSLSHIVFNMLMFHFLSRQMEGRYGAWRVALFVLGVALVSNLGQWAITGPYFGGMSGVVYGMFGFVWLKMLFDPRSGLFIDRFNVYLGIGWLFACMAADVAPFNQVLGGLIGPVANAAHFVGLAMGMAIAALPLAFQRKQA